MWLRIEDNELDAVVAALQSAKLDALTGRAHDMAAARQNPNTIKLIEHARKTYAQGSDDNIEVDFDAPISLADEHAFVGMWGYVPFADAGVPVSCNQCGEDMTVDDAGVAHHLTDDGQVDHDRDADHVAYHANQDDDDETPAPQEGPPPHDAATATGMYDRGDIPG